MTWAGEHGFECGGQAWSPPRPRANAVGACIVVGYGSEQASFVYRSPGDSDTKGWDKGFCKVRGRVGASVFFVE